MIVGVKIFEQATAWVKLCVEKSAAEMFFVLILCEEKLEAMKKTAITAAATTFHSLSRLRHHLLKEVVDHHGLSTRGELTEFGETMETGSHSCTLAVSRHLLDLVVVTRCVQQKARL
jgi:hypothetical protein